MDLRPPQRALRVIAGTSAVVGIVLGGAAASLSNAAPTADAGGAGMAATTPVGTGNEDPVAEPAANTSLLPLQVGSGANVLVLGDSLAVALYPYLGAQLPDRRVTYAAQEGQATGWAASRLGEELRRGAVPPVLVVSSGTNDGSDAELFRRNAERVLERAGDDRCVVWLTVHVPDQDSRSAVNAEIARLGGRNNVAIADWAAAVDQDPGLLIADRVHATGAGLLVRAELIAAAVHRCSPHDPDAPPPAYVPPPTDTRMPAQSTAPLATSASEPSPAASAGTGQPSATDSSDAENSSEPPTSEPGSPTASSSTSPAPSAPSASTSDKSGSASKSGSAAPASGG